MNAITSRHRVLGKIINLGNKERMVFFHKHWRPRRSVLFMPASNKRALEKAETLDCDAVIFDLEDAVSVEEQGEARENLRQLFGDWTSFDKERVIRISDVASDDFSADLAVATECKPDAILLPKTDDADHLGKLRDSIDKVGQVVQIWAMIETPRALMNLREIVSTAEATGLNCLIVGPNDLSKSTGAAMAPGRFVMLPWLMQVLAAARSENLSVLDGVYNAFRDLEGFEQECVQGAEMGFDGKTLIHPLQIEAANRAFSPSPGQLAKARQIIALFDQPENRGKGAVQLDGEMVERLHLDSARKLLAAFGKDKR